MDAVHRGRPKLEPDPQVRAAILEAALAIADEGSVQDLAISQVLARAHLSTRAFYRHFDSKGKLVTAMFAEIARLETLRLKQKMSGKDPIGAVVAWIEGRLDLAFDQQVESDFRQLSIEAHAQLYISPESIAPAYGEIIRPLIKQIACGKRLGLFAAGHAVEEAMSIHGVVWAHIERQWALGTCDVADVRKQVLRFCLRGVGAAADVIDEITSDEKCVERQLEPVQHQLEP
jgi:AcrR family transcriptional regulator